MWLLIPHDRAIQSAHAFLKYVMSLTLRSAPRSLGCPNGSSMWPSGDREGVSW